jgi:chorismate mutase
VSQETELDVLRREIDAIDRRILDLIAARMRAVLSIGAYKRGHGLPIYDPDRERRILESLAGAAPSPLTPDSARRIFERLIDEARTLEQHQPSG